MRSENGRTRVDFGSPAEVRVGVAFNLYASVFALACDGMRARIGAGCNSRAAEIVASLPPAAQRALFPIVAPGHSLCPDCLSPGDPVRDVSLADELDRLRSLSGAEVRADLELTFAPGAPPTHWQRALRNPRQWISQVADAFEDIGHHLQGPWQRSAGQREREAQRIGTAMARGCADVALAATHPRGMLRGTTLEFPDADPVELSASGRRVVLTPMIGRPESAPCNLDRCDVLWFGYPLAPSTDDRAAAQLDALLTPMRARLLRCLDRETPMSAVPTLLTCSAPTATHHCTQLAKAGLIDRRRQGRRVSIARTRRGDLLLEAYETAAP